MVPPEPVLKGVTEIRVHGVGGSSPATLLDDPSPQQVSGDRIAGFYRTKDRQGRHVEAYSWGGLTSRSRLRVLWLLLLPFMLANVAGWMAEPRTPVIVHPNETTKNPRPSRWRRVLRVKKTSPPEDKPPTSFLYRWVARVAGLAVTGNILTVITLGTVDVAAYQCGGMAGCTDQHWWLSPLTWDSLAAHPSRRVLLGALVACAAILILALLSYASRRRYEHIEPQPHDGSEGSDADKAGRASAKPLHPTAAALPNGLQHPDFWAGKDSHARLSRFHLAFAIATVALIVQYCSAATATGGLAAGVVGDDVSPVTWALGIAVLLSVVLFVGHDPRNQWASGLVVVGSLVCFTGAAWSAWAQPAAATAPGHLPGLRTAILGSWLITLGLLLPLLLWPLLQLIYRSIHGLKGRAYSRHFGWGAPFVVAATGIILADIVLLAMIVMLAKTLGSVVWSNDASSGSSVAQPIYLYPVSAMAITLIVMCSGVIIIAAAVVGFVAYLRAGGMPNATKVRWDLLKEYPAADETTKDERLKDWLKSALALDVDGASPLPKISSFVRSVARWRFLAAHTTKVLYVLTVLVAIAVCLIVLVHTGNADWIEANIAGLTPVMISVAVLIPPAILAFMWRSWSRVDNRKAIGVLWDVGTFWPRSFHPFAPPSYAERAVPELLQRIWWLNINKGRVVLTGHSQGSVLAAAALLRKKEHPCSADNQNVLVTFGSPVQKLYRWAFPAYLDDQVLITLAKGDSGIGKVRWRNFYYLTDVIGGPVVPQGLTGQEARATEGVDIELCDPAKSDYVFGQPEPAVGGHSGYWRDASMWKEVDSLAKDLANSRIADPHVHPILSQTRTRVLQPIVALIWVLPILMFRFWTEGRHFGQRIGSGRRRTPQGG
jgi:hypothetical protein